MGEESTEYPLTPFLDFAAGGSLEFEVDNSLPLGWGEMKIERRQGNVAPFGDYSGVGVDNPYLREEDMFRPFKDGVNDAP